MRTIARIGFVVALLASPLSLASNERPDILESPVPRSSELVERYRTIAAEWRKEAEKERAWAVIYGRNATLANISARKAWFQKMQQDFLAIATASDALAAAADKAATDFEGGFQAEQPPRPPGMPHN